MVLIVNFYGAPGSGKSTFAASLFARLKVDGRYKVELVTEFAKDLSYEGTLEQRQHQILNIQTKRLSNVQPHVDIIVTDSPLRLGEIYQGYSDKYIQEIKEQNKLENELNIFVHRGKQYQKYGRNQNESESDKIADRIYNLMDFDIEITSTNNIESHNDIVEEIWYDRFWSKYDNRNV